MASVILPFGTARRLYLPTLPLMRGLTGTKVCGGPGSPVSTLPGQCLRVCSLGTFSFFRRESPGPACGGPAWLSALWRCTGEGASASSVVVCGCIFFLLLSRNIHRVTTVTMVATYVKYTQSKVCHSNHIQVHNSVAVSTLTLSCVHRYPAFPQLFHHPRPKL